MSANRPNNPKDLVDLCRVIVKGPVSRDALAQVCATEADPESAMAACLADMKERGLRFHGEPTRESEVMQALLDALNEIDLVTARDGQSSRDTIIATQKRIYSAYPIMREATWLLKKGEGK